MADKIISELDELVNPTSSGVLPVSSGDETYKVSVENLLSKPQLSGLQTTNKTLVGAINEVAEGSSSSLEDLSDVDVTTPQDGQALIYDENSEKWVNGQGGGKQTAITQAEYDALVQAGTVDPTMEYFITDGIPAQSKIPDAPTTDGTYHLSVTVTSGVPTYLWVSDS